VTVVGSQLFRAACEQKRRNRPDRSANSDCYNPEPGENSLSAAGSRTTKVVPSTGSDRASMKPRCSVIIRR
jgi:hypothetical protein